MKTPLRDFLSRNGNVRRNAPQTLVRAVILTACVGPGSRIVTNHAAIFFPRDIGTIAGS
jgi:hypothetical protein